MKTRMGIGIDMGVGMDGHNTNAKDEDLCQLLLSTLNQSVYRIYIYIYML